MTNDDPEGQGWFIWEWMQKLKLKNSLRGLGDKHKLCNNDLRLKPVQEWLCVVMMNAHLHPHRGNPMLTVFQMDCSYWYCEPKKAETLWLESGGVAEDDVTGGYGTSACTMLALGSRGWAGLGPQEVEGTKLPLGPMLPQEVGGAIVPQVVDGDMPPQEVGG